MTVANIDARLDAFSATHGAVLLGMHKELTTLKAEIEAKLQSHTTIQSGIFSKTKSELARLTRLQEDIGRQQKLFSEYVEKDVKLWIKEQREKSERERQAVMKLLSEIKSGIAQHQQRVDSFNKITRRLVLAMLALLLGIAVWIWIP